MKDVSLVKRIAVHDGSYHADDTFAVASLRELNSQIEVVRTRAPIILELADMRIDVGGKHNPETGDYDHHQGAGTRENGVPYAAFGLVWRDYGAKVCEKVMKTGEIDRRMCEGIDLCIDYGDVAKVVDKRLVQAVDDYDNRWRPTTDLTKATPVFLQDIINAGHPAFFLKGDMDSCFVKAVDRARLILRDFVYDSTGSVLAGRFLEKSLAENTEPGIIVMKYPRGIHTALLGGHLARTESSYLYCVQRFDDNQFSAFVISDDYPAKEKIRKLFPASWAGLKNGPLRGITGVEDANYCFKSQSVTAQSLEGALALARKARDYQGEGT